METQSFEAPAPSDPIETTNPPATAEHLPTAEEIQAKDRERAEKKEERSRAETADRQNEQQNDLPRIEQAIQESDAPARASTINARNGTLAQPARMDRMDRFVAIANNVMQFVRTLKQKWRSAFEKKEQKQLKLSSQEIGRELPRVISEFKKGDGNMAALNVLYMNASPGMKGYIESTVKNQLGDQKMIGGSTVSLEATRYGRLFVFKYPNGEYNTGLNHALLEEDPTFVEKPLEAQSSAPAPSSESAVQAPSAAPAATATANPAADTAELAQLNAFFADFQAGVDQRSEQTRTELSQKSAELIRQGKALDAQAKELMEQRYPDLKRASTPPVTPTNEPAGNPSAKTTSAEQTSDAKVPSDAEIMKNILDGKNLTGNATITPDLASQILKQKENLAEKSINLGSATIDPETAGILRQFDGTITITLDGKNQSVEAIKELGKSKKLYINIANKPSEDAKTAIMELGENVTIHANDNDESQLKEFQDSRCGFLISFDTITPESAQLLAGRKGRTTVFMKDNQDKPKFTPEIETILRAAQGKLMIERNSYGKASWF